MEFSITKIKDSHLNEIVDVHMRAFPDFFLTFLGPRFLKEFYKSFIYDDKGLGLVAVDKNCGHVIGVAAGPLNPAGYFKRLLKRKFWAFCLASTGAVLKKPSVIKRLFRAFFYRGESPSGPVRALLSSIAVDPRVQGSGIGKSLILEWMKQVKAKGVKGCFLTTDAVNNEAVKKFYEKSGWVVEATYKTPEGRKMNRYIYDFEGRQSE
jgi:colanic acid biosynthesis glycosyl transferase WcaI